mmetsp:Transcript_35500/g.81953  ORF Transcript_35500/g.81953 Transcript_35500/m.81953 type:complete len:173 (+) Transcript_35500:853-1371(+)
MASHWARLDDLVKAATWSASRTRARRKGAESAESAESEESAESVAQGPVLKRGTGNVGIVASVRGTEAMIGGTLAVIPVVTTAVMDAKAATRLSAVTAEGVTSEASAVNAMTVTTGTTGGTTGGMTGGMNAKTDEKSGLIGGIEVIEVIVIDETAATDLTVQTGKVAVKANL